MTPESRTESTDFDHIIYVNTRGMQGRGIPEDIRNLRDWTWRRTAGVRWHAVEVEKLGEISGEPMLFVMDWSKGNSDSAKRVFEEIRQIRAATPILLVDSGRGHAPGRPRQGEGVYLIASDNLQDEKQAALAFQALRVALRQASLTIERDDRDLEIRSLLQSVPVERLERTILKYFPGAKRADIQPAVGGLSGNPVCWILVNGYATPYFLKFLRSSSEYSAEIANHGEARKWLGEATVALRYIPALEYSDDCGLEAFPTERHSSMYPICYESASNHNSPRTSLRHLYRIASDTSVFQAMERLLEVLARQDEIDRIGEMPWTSGGRTECPAESERIRTLLENLNDLAMYGPAVCNDWKNREGQLLSFAYGPWPGWLQEPTLVATGKIHGDPNSTNCLVSPSDPKNLTLIDCGKFDAHGRLVSDLALIEADIKFAQLGTEEASLNPQGLWENMIQWLASGSTRAMRFRDLDCRKISGWCEAERRSVKTRLDFEAAHVGVFNDKSVWRAYSLVARIRSRAREISGETDKNGAHYFAALLFWTIRFLKMRHIRPTKKLLALYSISEILSRFADA